jgi:hypothetical protein
MNTKEEEEDELRTEFLSGGRFGRRDFRFPSCPWLFPSW